MSKLMTFLAPAAAQFNDGLTDRQRTLAVEDAQDRANAIALDQLESEARYGGQ